MYNNGHIGQVKGPFNANVDLLEENQAIGSKIAFKGKKIIIYKAHLK